MTGRRPLASRHLHSGISTYYAQVSLPGALCTAVLAACGLPHEQSSGTKGADSSCATSLDAQRLLTGPVATPHDSTAMNSFADSAAASRRHCAPATPAFRGLCSLWSLE